MALKIQTEFSGIDLSGAYCRVGNTQITTPYNGPYSISIHIDIFASMAAKEAGAKPLSGMDFTFTDIPEKREMKQVVIDGVPQVEDGKKVMEEVVTPAKPDFTELYTILSNGGDPRAMVYNALKARRPEFAQSTDI